MPERPEKSIDRVGIATSASLPPRDDLRAVIARRRECADEAIPERPAFRAPRDRRADASASVRDDSRPKLFIDRFLNHSPLEKIRIPLRVQPRRVGERELAEVLLGHVLVL